MDEPRSQMPAGSPRPAMPLPQRILDLVSERPRSQAWVAVLLLFVLTAGVWQWRVVEDAEKIRLFTNGDLFIYFYPLLDFSYGGDASASLLWNPHSALGMPNLATLQAGLLYPPHALYWVLPTAFCMGLLAFLHILLGGLAAALLARSLGCVWPAVLVCGSASAFSYLIAALYWPSFLEPLPWILLTLAAIERTVVLGDRRFLLLVGLSIGMGFLAGGYQAVIYGVLAAALYTLLALVELAHRESLIASLKRGAAVLLAACLGLALASPQLLATYELATQGSRLGGALQANQIHPLGPQYPSVAALADRLLNPPPNFIAGYAGAVPVVLAGLAIFSRRWRLLAFCAFAGLWAGLNMLGPRWFILAQLQLPPLAWFRSPERAVLILQVCIAVAAALGVDAWLRRAESRQPLRLWAGVAALLCLGVSGSRYPGALWWLPLVLLPALWPTRNAPLRWLQAGLVLALVVFDLTASTRNTLALPWVDEAWRKTRFHEPELGALRQLAGPNRVILAGAADAHMAWNNKTPLVNRLDSVHDYEPLATRLHRDFLSFAAHRGPWPDKTARNFTGHLAWSDDPEHLRAARPFLALMNVRYYAFREKPPQDRVRALRLAGLVPVPDRRVGPGRRRLSVFEDLRSLPRAYGVYAWECESDEGDALRRLAAPDFDGHSSVLLAGNCESPPPAQAHHPAPRVEITSHAPTRVHVLAEFAAAGQLVLADSFYPGWHAYVDGTEVPVRRANLLARAVAVSAGNHQVRFEYRPGWLWPGLVGAGLATGVGAAYALHLSRSRRRGMRGSALSRNAPAQGDSP